MTTILRDVLLSFCPAALRQKIRPYSPLTMVRAAIWLGLAQVVICSFLLVTRYRHFFETRAQLWSGQMRGTPEWFQAGAAVLITFEFLLYPISVVLLYFLVEGFVRFAAGLITSEAVPTLPVWLGFKVIDFQQRRNHAHHLKLILPDRFEVLPEQRLRISSALPKAGWNGSITISIDDHWYEIESEETGSAPHPYIYLLRPTPPGKILRRLEQYELSQPNTQESEGTVR